jgi:hypothetical protein
MANRYWVGGSGTWDQTTTTNWSTTSGGTGGATAPTPSDNVFFNQAGTYTVTLSSTNGACLNMTVSAGTVTFNTNSVYINVNGNLTLTSNTVVTSASTFGLQLSGTNSNLSFTQNAANLSGCDVTFNGVGGAWYLGSELTLGNTRNIILTNGSLFLNGYNATAGVFSSNNANTRSINFGSTNITLNHPTPGTAVLNMATGTGLTCTGTGGFITDALITRTINSCTTGAVANAPNLTLTSGSSVVTLTQPGKFNKLDFGTTAFNPGTISVDMYSLVLSPNGTYTSFTPQMTSASGITSTMTTNGKTISNLAFTLTTGTTTLLDSVTTGATANTLFTSGTLNLNGFNLTTGQFSSTNANTRSILFGAGNIILNHSTAGTTVLDMGIVTGFTYTATTGGWVTDAATTRTLVFGTTGGTATNAPSLTFTGSGNNVVGIQGWFNKVDYGTTAFNPGGVAVNISSLTLSATGTYTTFAPTIVGTGILTSNGVTFGGLTINHSGVTTLADAITLTATATTTLTLGTLNLNGFNLTTGIFSSNNSNSRAITFGSNNIILAHTTASTTVLSMATASNFSQTGTGGFVTNASITRTIIFGNTGGTTTNAPNLTFTGNGNAVITFSGLCWFNTLDFGATAFNPGAAQVSINSLILSASGTYSTFVVTFAGTGSINTNGRTLDIGFTVNHTGTTTLLSNVTCSFAVLGGIALTSGTLNLNNFTITTQTFNSSGSTTRSIQFGTGNIVLYYLVANTTVISMNVMNGFTWTGTGGFRIDADRTQFIATGTSSGATSANAPNLTFTGTGSSTVTLSGSYFNVLNFGTTAFNTTSVVVNCNSLVLSGSGTYSSMLAIMIGTGTVTTNGNTTLSGLTINAPGGTTSLASATTLAITAITTLTAGTLALNGFNLTTGTFSSDNSNTRVIAFGTNNIILRTSTAAATNIDMATMTGFTYTGTGGFVSDGTISRIFTVGTTAGGTSANAISLSFTSGSTAPLITTGSRLNNLDVSLITATYSVTAITVNSMNFNASSTYTAVGITLAGTSTFNTLGRSIGAFAVNNSVGAGTVTLGASVSCTTFTLTSGTLNLSTFNIVCTAGGTDGNIVTGTLNGSGTIACQQLTISGTFNLTTGTLSPSVSLNISGNFTYSGGTISATSGVNQTGGTFLLGKAYALSATGTYTLTAGTLNLGGFNLTTGIFNSSSTSTRSIVFGSNNIILATTTAASLNLGMPDVTNFTWTGTGGFTAAADITRSFTFGTTSGSATNAPNLTFTGSGSAIQTLTTGSWFKKLDFGSTAFTVAVTTLNLNSLTLSSGGTFTSLTATFVGDVTRPGTLISNGKQLGAVAINSTNTVTLADATATGNLTMTSGTLDCASFAITVILTLTYTSGTLLNIGTITANAVSVGGAWTLTQGTINVTSSFTLAGGTFTYNGGTISLNQSTGSFVHTSGTFTVNAAFSIGTLTYTFTAGTINLNGYNLTVGIFSSTGVGVRTIRFGNNNIVLAHTTAAQTVLSISNATNFTCTGPGGFATDASVTRTFDVGTTASTAANAPNLLITSGSATPTFTDGSWFKTLNFTGSTCAPVLSTSFQGINVDTLTLATGGDYTNFIPVFTRSQIWIPQFSKQLGGMGLNLASGTLRFSTTQSFTTTSTFFLVQGTLDLSGYDLTVGTFSSNNFNTRSITFGSNNIILNHTTAATTVLNMATASNFTYTGTGGFTTDASTTRTISFGSTLGGEATNAPNITLTGSGTSVVTLTNGSWFNSLNFGSTAFTTASAGIFIASNLTLSSGGSYTFLNISHVGTGTITSNNKTIAVLTISHTGTTTLSGALTINATSTTTLTSGTLNLNGFNLTTGAFSSSNTNTRGIVFGTNNIILNHTTAATTVLSMTDVTNFTRTATTGGFVTDASITRTVVFGTTGGSSTRAPNLTFTGSGSQVVTITTGSYFNTLDFGTTAFNPSTITVNCTSLVLSSGGTFVTVSANMLGTAGTITPNGKTIAALVINNGTGTTTLAGNLGCTTYSQLSGTIDFATFNLTCSSTAAYSAGTLSNIGTISCTTWTCTGNFILTSGTITPSVSFVVVGGFNYSGGTLSAVPLFTLTSGTFNLNGFNLTTGTFSSNNSNTRAIQFGTGNIILNTATVSATNIDMATATGFTYTGTGGFTTSMTVTRTFTFGTTDGSITNAPNLSITSGTSVPTFTDGSWFNTLNFTGSTCAPAMSATVLGINVSTLTLATGGTYTSFIPAFTSTQTWTPQFSLALGGIGINGAGITVTLGGAQTFATNASIILTQGTFNLNGYDLTVGIFSSNNSNTRSVIFGSNNITLNHTTAATLVLSMATASGFSYTGTGGFITDATIARSFNVGGTALTNVDSAPNLTFTTGSVAPTFPTVFPYSYFTKLDFGSTTFTTGATFGVNSNTLILSSGGTYATLQYSTIGSAAGTFTTNGKTITTFNVNSTITFNGSLTVTGSLSLTRGVINLNNFNITTPIFSSSNTNVRSINFGTGSIILNGAAAGNTVLVMTIATNFTCTGTGGFSADASVTKTYTFGTTGGSATNSPNLTLTGAGTAIATFTTGSYFNILNFGGTAFTVPATTLNLNGLVLSTAAGVYTNLTINMVGTGNITSNGKTLGAAFTINHNGTTTLNDTFTNAATGTITLTSGTLNLNNFNVTTGIFSSSNSNIRSIIFGSTVASGYISIQNATNASTLLDMFIATNFSCTGAAGFATSATTNQHTFNFGSVGGSAANAPNLKLQAGAGIQIFGVNSWFKTLDFTGSTCSFASTTSVYVDTLILATGGTYTNLVPIFTRTQTWTPQFSKQLGGIGFNLTGGTLTLENTQTYIAASNLVVNEGTIDLASLTLTFGTVTIAGTGTFANLTNLSAGTFNVNAGYTYTHSAGTLTITTLLNILGIFNQTAGTISGTIPTITLSAGSIISSVNTITCTTFNANGGTIFNGNISSTTFTIAAALGFTFNGGSISGAMTMTSGAFTYISGTILSSFTHTAGTTTLSNNLSLTATATYTLTAGILNLNGFNLTVGLFSSNTGSTRTVNFSTGNIVLTATSGTVIDMLSLSGFTYTGTGGFTADASVIRTYSVGSTLGGTSTNAPNLTFTGFGTAIPVLTTGGWFNILNFGSTSFTLAVTTLNVNSLTLSTGGTFTNLTVTTVGTGSIKTNGKTIAALTINCPSGTTTLADALTTDITAVVTNHLAGTLNLNGFNLTVGSFASSNNNTRAIAFGTSSIILKNTSPGQAVVAMANATGFTYTGTGGFVSDASVTRTFTFGTTGGSITNAPNLSITSGAGILTFTDGSWFNILNFTGCTSTPAMSDTALGINIVSGLILASGGTYTNFIPSFVSTQTWTPQFNKDLGGMIINGAGITLILGGAQTFATNATLTLTQGTLNLNGYSLTTGIFSSNNANTRSIAFGTGTIALAHTTAATTVLNMTTATGFTYTGTGGFTVGASITRTLVFGTTGGTSTNAPNLTYTGSGSATQTLTTGSYFNTLTFGTVSCNIAATTLNLNGLTLSTQAYQENITVNMVGTGTITSNGQPIGALATINHSGTTTLLGNLSMGLYTASGVTTTLTSGTLNLNGYTLTTGAFSSDNSNTRSIIFGSSNIILNHTTAGTAVLAMATITGFIWTGTGGFVTDDLITRTYTVGSTAGTANGAVNLLINSTINSALPTITTNSKFNILNFGTTSFTLAATTLYVSNLILSSTGVYTNVIPILTRSQTWTMQYSKQLGGLGFSYIGGALTLDGTQTFTTNSTFNLIAGTLNLGGYDLTVGIFSSNNSNNRNIIFGSNNIILNHPTPATTVLDMSQTFGFLGCTGTGGFVTDASITRTLTFGTLNGSPTISPNLTYTGFGSAIQTLTTLSYFNKLNFGSTTFSPGTITLNLNSLILSTVGTYSSLSINMVGTGTITSNGRSLSAISIVNPGITTTLADAHTSSFATFTLTQGTLDLKGFTLTIGSFSSNNSNTRSIIFGSANIVFSAGVLSALLMATATGFTYTGTGGFVGPTTSSANGYSYVFGTTGGSTTNAPNLNLSGYTGSSVQGITTGSWFNTLSFASTTFNPGTISLNVNSLVLSSTGTYSTMTVTMVGTGSITSNGNTSLLALTINSSGTTSFLDALSMFGFCIFTLTAGTLNLSGFTLSVGIFNSSGTGVRSIAFGSNNIVLVTGNTTLITMADITNFSYTGTGGFSILSYGTITIGSSAGGSATNAPNVIMTEYFPTLPRTLTITTGSWINTLDGSSSTVNLAMSSTGFNAYVNVSTLLLGSASVALYNQFAPAFTRSQTWTVQNNKQLAGLGVNGTGVTLKLGDTAQQYSSTAWFNLVSGTLDLNGYNLTIGGFWSSNTLTRSILFGSNNIILTHATAATTALYMYNTINFSWTGTGGFISTMDVSRTFSFAASDVGVVASNAPNLTITSSPGIASFIGGSWFNVLNFTGFNSSATSNLFNTAGVNIVDTLTLSIGGDYTSFVPGITKTSTWTSQYNKQLGGIAINAIASTVTLDNTQTYTAASTVYLYNGTLNLSGADLTIGIFSSSVTNSRSIAFGSNNIILTSATTALAMAIATGFTYTGTGGFSADASVTRTYTFGTTGGSAINSPNLALTGNGTAIATLTSNSWFNTLNFGSTAFVLGTTTLNINTLTLSSGGTFTALTPIFTRTQTWTMQQGKQLGGIGFNLAGGTLTLDSTQTYIATAILTLTQGTLNLSGNVTIGTFSSNNTNTRAIAFGSNNIVLSTTTASATNIDMATATNFSWTGTGGFRAASDIIRVFTFGSTTGGTASNAPNLALTSGAAVPTFTATSWFNILDFTGTTFTAPASSPYVNTLILAAGGTYTSFAPILTSTQTWTAQFNKQLGGLGFNLINGTLTLDNTQTYTATSTFTLQGGTLDLAGTNLSVGSFVANTLTTQQRAINFGFNYINLIHTTAATTVLDIITSSTSNTFVCSGTGGFSTNMTITRTVQCYGVSRTDTRFVKNSVPNLFVTAGAAVLTFRYQSIFNKIDFTGSTTSPTISTIPSFGIYCNSLILASGGTYTGFNPIFMSSTLWTPQFSKQLSGMGICNTDTGGFLRFNGVQSFTGTSTFSLEAGTLDLNGFDMTIGEFLGGFNSTFGSSVIAFGSNNITLAHTTASTQVLVVTPATNVSCTGTGGFVADASIIRSFRWGDTGGGTSAAAPNLTLTSGAAIPTFQTGSWFNRLNFGLTAFTVATTTLNVNSITTSSAGTFFNLTINMVGTGTIISNGKYFNTININTPGTVTMGDALAVAAGTLTFTTGIWNLSGFTHILTSITSSTSLTRRIIGPGSVTLNQGIVNISDGSNFTGTGYNININMNTSTTYNFIGGGGQFGTLNLICIGAPPITASLSITGSNSFENINATVLPIIITLPAGITQTVSAFSLSGRNSGASVSINSSVSDSQAPISNPNEVISANYMILKDSNATGGAGWYANTISTNLGNNTGWQFTAPPTPAPILGQGFAFC